MKALNRTERCSATARAAVALTGLLLLGPSPASAGPVTASSVDVLPIGPNPQNIHDTLFASGPVAGPSESSGAGSFYGAVTSGEASADFGLLKAESEAKGGDGSSGGGTISNAAFADIMTITGGTGTGIAGFGMGVRGTISTDGSFNASNGAPALPPESNSAIALLQMTAGNLNTSTPGTVQAEDGTALLGGVSFEVNLPPFTFTYGQPFELFVELQTFAGANENTQQWGTSSKADFFDTAVLNEVILPPGAVLTAASGTHYPITPQQVSGVPEPSSLTLLAIGIAGLAAYARRRRARPPVGSGS